MRKYILSAQKRYTATTGGKEIMLFKKRGVGVGVWGWKRSRDRRGERWINKRVSLSLSHWKQKKRRPFGGQPTPSNPRRRLLRGVTRWCIPRCFRLSPRDGTTEREICSYPLVKASWGEREAAHQNPPPTRTPFPNNDTVYTTAISPPFAATTAAPKMRFFHPTHTSLPSLMDTHTTITSQYAVFFLFCHATCPYI